MQQDKDYQELRKLLLAPEQHALDQIQEDLKQSRNNKVNDVAEVLSDSLRLSTKNDKTLSQSLQPAVEDCIQQSVKQDAQFFADILFPIMGPAIRKSIADALKEVVDSINNVMEQSFSVEALKWRWQSFTTGKSYGEIVLKNTLLYRVDQVFLINRDSGLLMQYVSHPDWQKGKGKMDSDAISAMLTAIQDFMHDSFNVQESDQLDSIDMGDSTILLSHGPKATLACKVRGNANIKGQMQEALEAIHLNYFRDMEEFDGDRRSMQGTIPILEPLLLEQKKQGSREKKKSFFASPFFFIFIFLLLAIITFLVWRYWENKQFNDYVNELDKVPGIVVTDAARHNGRFRIEGLQDPLFDISTVSADTSIANKIDYQLSPYQSLEPIAVLARAKSVLQIPEVLEVEYKNTILILSGHLKEKQHIDWYTSLQNTKVYLAGIDRIDTAAITVEQANIKDFLEKHNALLESINKTVFYFINADDLQENEQNKLVPLIQQLSTLEQTLADYPWHYQVVLTGHSDSSGSTERNQSIRLQRANTIKNRILANKRFNLVVNTFDNIRSDSREVDYSNRKVTLQVIVK